jgi:hypothetical protein
VRRFGVISAFSAAFPKKLELCRLLYARPCICPEKRDICAGGHGLNERKKSDFVENFFRQNPTRKNVGALFAFQKIFKYIRYTAYRGGKL